MPLNARHHAAGMTSAFTRERQRSVQTPKIPNVVTPPAAAIQLDSPRHPPYLPPLASAARVPDMRIRNSLKSAKVRDKNCRVVRRHGRVYVINKKNPRMKCRQG